MCVAGCFISDVVRSVTGETLHVNGLYMMQDIHPGISPCTMTVEEIMRGNFCTAWPNSDAVVLQLDSRDGVAMNWRELLARSESPASTVTAVGQDMGS